MNCPEAKTCQAEVLVDKSDLLFIFSMNIIHSVLKWLSEHMLSCMLPSTWGSPMISPLIWICNLCVPIWSQYTVPHSDPSLVSILFEHIILKLMCFLWNSGHFPSHFRTFLVEFCRNRRLRAFPKILKILASSLFSLPCLTFFLTLFEPNSE